MKSRQMIKAGLIFMSCGVLLMGCGQEKGTTADQGNTATEEQTVENEETIAENYADATQIMLSDNGITVDGEAVAAEDAAAVYVANDIVYYEEAKISPTGKAQRQMHIQKKKRGHIRWSILQSRGAMS